jgi:hypothetical protein
VTYQLLIKPALNTARKSVALGVRSVRQIAQRRQRYVGAVHAGLDRNYAPMAEIFRAGIARTLRGQPRASSS